MDRRLIILDLDRTIFDTARFAADVRHLLHQTHKINLARFQQSYSQFFDANGSFYRLHDHYEHLIGLAPEALETLVRQRLAGVDYAFPDATAWLRTVNQNRTRLVVVTTGEPRYQRLKFDHARAFANLEFVTVPSDKGALISQHLEQPGPTGAGEFAFLQEPYTSITIIDDAVKTFLNINVSRPIECIRIARPGEKYAELPTPPGVRHITSFEELS